MKRSVKSPPFEVRAGTVFDKSQCRVTAEVRKAAASGGGAGRELKVNWSYGPDKSTSFDIITGLTPNRYVPAGSAPDVTKDGVSISIKEAPADYRDAPDYADQVAGFDFLRAFADYFGELYVLREWYKGFGDDHELKMPPKMSAPIEQADGTYVTEVEVPASERFKLPVTHSEEYGDELTLKCPASLHPTHAANGMEIEVSEFEQLGWAFRASTDKRLIRSHRSRKWHMTDSELKERSGGIDRSAEDSIFISPMIAKLVVWPNVWWKPHGSGNFQGCGLVMYCQQMSLYTDEERGSFAPLSIRERFTGPDYDFMAEPGPKTAPWFRQWRQVRLSLLTEEDLHRDDQKRESDEELESPDAKRPCLESPPSTQLMVE